VADSIAISGHIFIGSPIPCGIVIAKKMPWIAFIGTLDTTISGSRYGLTPSLLWYAIRLLGKNEMRNRVTRSLDVATYALEKLKEMGVPAWRNSDAITVVFPSPSQTVMDKSQLVLSFGRSHIIAMPGTDCAEINRSLKDMEEDLEKEK
jgi:histidine decarboxylase|tara:strand:- start:49 stop:495 length:447 start_codon:yes stop_codon:yes gene_type:complete